MQEEDRVTVVDLGASTVGLILGTNGKMVDRPLPCVSPRTQLLHPLGASWEVRQTERGQSGAWGMALSIADK